MGRPGLRPKIWGPLWWPVIHTVARVASPGQYDAFEATLPDALPCSLCRESCEAFVAEPRSTDPPRRAFQLHDKVNAKLWTQAKGVPPTERDLLSLRPRFEDMTWFDETPAVVRGWSELPTAVVGLLASAALGAGDDDDAVVHVTKLVRALADALEVSNEGVARALRERADAWYSTTGGTDEGLTTLSGMHPRDVRAAFQPKR